VAQRVQVLLVCDMHGDETPAEESVSFSVNGTSYELDVCAQHAAALRDAFAPFVGVARKAGGRGGGGRRRRGGANASGRAGEIRDWARAQGITVSERGRIPADLAAKYDAAH
jgi:hypothetical protein